MPLLPRGGGTSQSGQTVGRALVLDFSKHLKRIVALDAEAANLHGRAGHRAGRSEPAAQVDGAVVPGRCLHRQPRHHRRHGRQQLVRHALDPLRHHARQRAGHRCDPGRRQRGALRRGGAQPRTPISCARRASPSPCAGRGQGWGAFQTLRPRALPAPHPALSPQGGGGSVGAIGEARPTSPCSATSSPSAGARRSTSCTPSPRYRAASAAI